MIRNDPIQSVQKLGGYFLKFVNLYLFYFGGSFTVYVAEATCVPGWRPLSTPHSQGLKVCLVAEALSLAPTAEAFLTMF